MSRLKQFISEIHRRSLWQVLLIYVGGAWVCYEIIDTITDRLALPEWLPVLAIILFLIGLPVVLATAFVREVAPPTVRPAEPTPVTEAEAARVEAEAAAVHHEARRRDRFLTWRNAAASFVVALALWGVVAIGWLALHERRSASAHDIRSLAVLPLENLSDDPDQEYFADGMTEALIGQLAQISALRVISRTSAMQYKDARPQMSEIARELNVDAVVEGTVLRAGERVRITAQLIHAPSDRHLWAESYERDLGDILALQSEVARAIAREINVAITPGEVDRLTTTSQVDPDAYQAYVLGLFHYDRYSPHDFELSVRYFEQAIARDSTFASAHAALATAYTAALDYGWLDSDRAAALAESAAHRAIELDPGLGDPHRALAELRQFVDLDFQAAEREYRRAIELTPNAYAFQGYGFFLSVVGRDEEAVAALERAVELDPRSALMHGDLAWRLYGARQFERAIEESLVAIELDPGYPEAHLTLAEVYGLQGRYDVALEELDRYEELYGEPSLRWRAYFYALAGRREDALAVLRDLETRYEQGTASAHAVALVHMGLGDRDKVFEYLMRGAEARDIRFFPPVYREFDALHTDRRWQDYLRSFGLRP